MYTWTPFSAHNSFSLDLRSFWLFMLTWVRERAFVSWRTGIYTFFPGKYAHNFGFKMVQAEKMPKEVSHAYRAFLHGTAIIAALIQLMWFQNVLTAIPLVLVGVTSFIPTKAAAQQQEAVGSMIPNIHGKNKNMFQTTNQLQDGPPQL